MHASDNDQALNKLAYRIEKQQQSRQKHTCQAAYSAKQYRSTLRVHVMQMCQEPSGSHHQIDINQQYCLRVLLLVSCHAVR
jgi:hypothetical protein